MKSIVFQRLAALARYPRGDYFDHLEAALVAAPDSQSLQTFAASIASESITHLQELYTKTFDLNPVCAPELGWHLFGETYERGAFLVRMKRELRDHNIAEGSELPDHLACALELVSKMSIEAAEYFVEACLTPAIHKMTCAISETNAFQPLILAVRESLEAAFPVARDFEGPVTLTVLNEGAME